jgi:hypothetical protein
VPTTLSVPFRAVELIGQILKIGQNFLEKKLNFSSFITLFSTYLLKLASFSVAERPFGGRSLPRTYQEGVL